MTRFISRREFALRLAALAAAPAVFGTAGVGSDEGRRGDAADGSGGRRTPRQPC